MIISDEKTPRLPIVDHMESDDGERAAARNTAFEDVWTLVRLRPGGEFTVVDVHRTKLEADNWINGASY